MEQQIDLNALADFALATFDCDADYEDDAFAVSFQGARIYVERKKACFVLHVGAQLHRLPRC